MHLIDRNGVRHFAELNISADSIVPFINYLNEPIAGAVVELETHSDIEPLTEHLAQIAQVVIRIESHADGRGFSLAHQLRHRLGFTKPIWAKGDLIADQFPHAIRCGFDAVLISEQHFIRQPVADWTEALKTAPIPYRCGERATNSQRQARLSNLTVNDHTITHLNEKYTQGSTEQLMTDVFKAARFGKTALVSSFGTESAVLLHMLSKVNREAEVIFIDTGKLFQETLDYQQRLTDKLLLSNVKVLTPDQQKLSAIDATGLLHKSDLDSCCKIRKVEPLQRAIKELDSWVSGRKSFQNSSRQNLAVFEKSGTHIKINPLANWTKEQVSAYMKEHNLPEHPLQELGYQSVGCEPCTTPVSANENSRSGRWRGADKSECGIHYIDGRLERAKNETTEREPKQIQYAAVCDSWSY